MKQIAIFLILFFFILSSQALAVTVTINNFPSEIISDPFDVDVSVQGAAVGTNYLRVLLYKKDTDNYFAETFNNTNWYGGGDGLQYFPIIINEKNSTVSAVLKARVGDPAISEYSGKGIYQLRIKRYTNSGNAASNDDCIPVELNINIDLPTPTPIPIVSIKPESTPSSKPSATAIKIYASSSTVTKKAINSPENSPLIENEDILGEINIANSSILPETDKNSTQEGTMKNNWGAILILISGLLFSIAAGFVAYQKSQKSKNLV